MKKIFCLAIVLAVFVNVNTFSATRKSSSSKKSSSSQINSEAAQVALKFIEEYTEILENDLENNTGDIPDASNPEDYDVRYIYLKATNLITKRYRNELLETIVANYAEEDGGGVDPVLGLQDFDTEWKIVSYNSKNGNVLLQGPTFKVKVKVKNVNGKWLVDNSGF